MGSRKRRSRSTVPFTGPTIPLVLRDTLSSLIGEELNQLESALNEQHPTSIRVNPAKGLNINTKPVPWCSAGRYLNERPSFTFDPYFHAGAYYVQEASSMFLEKAVEATGMTSKRIVALDLCAAPGGKSTHLRSLLSPDSLLVANETDNERRSILQENLWKWGGKNVVISGSDPSDLVHIPEFFDMILVDAPCSGEGMFRKDPFARAQWDPGLVDRCATIQAGVVMEAWKALAPGGVLIYSTCTWEPKENEMQVRSIQELGAICMEIPLLPEWGIEKSTLHGVIGYRCYPHRVQGEGFFLSMLRKPGCVRERDAPVITEIPQEQRLWLADPDEIHITIAADELYAVDACWSNVIPALQRALHNVIPGIPIAIKKGHGLQPHPALALSAILNDRCFDQVDLSYEDAIKYLRGEALSAPQVSGAALATYAGLPMGWLHGVGKRYNNRWPNTWRIRSREPGAPLVSWAAKL